MKTRVARSMPLPRVEVVVWILYRMPITDDRETFMVCVKRAQHRGSKARGWNERYIDRTLVFNVQGLNTQHRQ